VCTFTNPTYDLDQIFKAAAFLRDVPIEPSVDRQAACSVVTVGERTTKQCDRRGKLSGRTRRESKETPFRMNLTLVSGDIHRHNHQVQHKANE
jgi:hypothetical protein